MLEELAQHVEALLGPDFISRRLALGELTVVVPAQSVVSVLRTLRDDPQCQFEQLIDICGVDYPEREQRFDVVYHLLSPRQNLRLRVKCAVDEATPVPSVVELFACANW